MSSTTPLVLLSAHHIHVPSSSSPLTSLSTSAGVPVSPGRPLFEQYPAEGGSTAHHRSGPSVAQSPPVPRVLDPVTTKTGEASGAYLLRRRDYSPHHSASLTGPSPGHIDSSRADPMEHPDGCFHSFSKLPLELRLTIWNLSISHPRIVPIHLSAASPSEDPTESGNTKTTAPQCVSPCPAPANLYVCRESRAEALKCYQLSFGMYRSPGRIFFNPESDILYFGWCEGYGASAAQFCTVMALCAPEDLARVKRLAINEAVFKVGCKYVHSLAADVLEHVRARVPELEELVFVPAREAEPSLEDEYDFGSALVDINLTGETAGMAAQVQAAVQDFSETHPEWERPRCRVMALDRGPGRGSSSSWGSLEPSQGPSLLGVP